MARDRRDLESVDFNMGRHTLDKENPGSLGSGADWVVVKLHILEDVVKLHILEDKSWRTDLAIDSLWRLSECISGVCDNSLKVTELSRGLELSCLSKAYSGSPSATRFGLP